MKNSSSLLVCLTTALLLSACAGQQATEDAPLQLTSQTPEPVAETPADVSDESGFLATVGIDPYTQQVFPPLSNAYKKAYRQALELLKNPEQQDEAEAALLVLTTHEEQSAAPYLQLANLYKQKKMPDKAIAFATKAISISPYNYAAYTLQAIVYRELGQFEKAEANYQAILKRWQGYAPAHRNLGILYDLYMGKQIEAADHYQKYLLLVGEDRQVAIWLADLQRRLPQKSEPGSEQLSEDAATGPESGAIETPAAEEPAHEN